MSRKSILALLVLVAAGTSAQAQEKSNIRVDTWNSVCHAGYCTQSCYSGHCNKDLAPTLRPVTLEEVSGYDGIRGAVEFKAEDAIEFGAASAESESIKIPTATEVSVLVVKLDSAKYLILPSAQLTFKADGKEYSSDLGINTPDAIIVRSLKELNRVTLSGQTLQVAKTYKKNGIAKSMNFSVTPSITLMAE